MEYMTLTPKKLNSKMYKNISYKKVLADNLQVMDSSAISMARDNLIPMVVFSILKKFILKRQPWEKVLLL